MAGYKTWASNDVPSSSDVNTYLMQQAVPRFSTVAARDAAITSPASGQLCATSDFNEIYLRNGPNTAWIGCVPRVVYKPATTSRTSSSLVADPDLHITLEASSKYVMDWAWQYQGATADDIHWTFTYSGSMAVDVFGIMHCDITATTANNSNKKLDAYASLSTTDGSGCVTGDVLGMFGSAYLATTTSGTYTLTWGSISGSGSVDLSYGSYMSLLKVG